MSSFPYPVRIDIKTAPHQTTYDTILRYWQEAEADETFSGAWLFDHFQPIDGNPDGPCLEGWTLLGALAAVTKRLRLGLMVTGNSYRNPAVLAKIASTVDIVSDGRLDFGIGAGWNEAEYIEYGFPFPPPADRIRAMGEACTLIKLLWTQHLSDFDGRYYQLKGARCEPKPVQKPWPPFVIGGSGEKLTLREVARHADVSNISGATPEEVRRKLDILEGHCADVGRDPREIRYSWQTYLKKPEDIEGLSAKLRSFVEVGVDHFVVGLPGVYMPGFVAAVSAEVAPLLSLTPKR